MSAFVFIMALWVSSLQVIHNICVSFSICSDFVMYFLFFKCGLTKKWATKNQHIIMKYHLDYSSNAIFWQRTIIWKCWLFVIRALYIPMSWFLVILHFCCILQYYPSPSCRSMCYFKCRDNKFYKYNGDLCCFHLHITLPILG